MKDEDLLRLVGKNVQRYRKRMGLTQEKLGARAHFHSTYIGMIERAERKISILAAYKLANTLGVTLNDLVTTEYE